MKDIERELSEKDSNARGSKRGVISQLFAIAKRQLRFPINKPEVYRPLLLIITITCLQHFSGFTFTKKFLLQVLAPSKELDDGEVSGEDPSEEEDYTGYYFAILINVIRTIANLMMSNFLKRFRVRFLFCLSLFSTALCLAFFGCFLPFGPFHEYLTPQADQIVRVAILAIHVFAVQFGLQSLAGQLTDTLLPSHAKPMLKGFIRSIQSLSLIAFVSLITLIPEEEYAACRFWTMGGALILASPFLYFGVPELRHLGRAAWEFYFSPAQTIFYFVIPNAEESRAWKTVKKWSIVISAVMRLKKFSVLMDSSDTEENEISSHKCLTFQRQKTLERVGNENQIATFHPNTLDEMKENEELKKRNKLSVTFVENILGMNNWLAQNPNPDRLILARGPAKCVWEKLLCVQENFSVGVFLFSDVIIVARKLMKNRKYRILITLKIDTNFGVSRDELEVTFKNGSNDFAVSFSDQGNAIMWQQYANYWKEVKSRSGENL